MSLMKKMLVGGAIVFGSFLNQNDAIAQNRNVESREDSITAKYDSLRNAWINTYESVPENLQESFHELYTAGIKAYDNNQDLRLKILMDEIPKGSSEFNQTDKMINHTNSVLDEIRTNLSLSNLINSRTNKEIDSYRFDLPDMEYGPLFNREERDTIESKQRSYEIIFGND